MTVPVRLTSALSDRYRIQRELGQGGMATVYLADDLKHDRKVAVKVLRPELAAVIGAERFLSEIKTTANLQHPHILPLFDSGVADSFLFYVMPYVEGESLRDRLTREKQLSIPDAVRIATEVASALDYAHRHGVIHRDIKPENILLHDGSALVADFGIALAASKAGSRMTETGMSLGTPHYMSPEQAMGEREITARSDVYALGCVLYEMLVGQPPFTGATAQAIVAKVVTEKPAALITQRDTVPEPVEDAVLIALAKLPADRFASAADFATALAGKAAGSPRRSRRQAIGGWRLGAMLAGTAAIAGVGGALLRGKSPANAGATVRFVVPAHLGDIDYGPGLDISHDGSQIVFVGRDANGRTGLFLRGMADGEVTPIPGTGDAIVRSPKFSPDGQMVAYTSESKLRVLSIHGGGERTVVDGVSPASGGLSWGPGDVIVFQPNFGTGLSVVNVKDGKIRQLTRVDSAKGEEHRWPQVLPDGKSVIFTIWNGADASAQVAIASLATGDVRVLFPGESARFTDDGHLVFIGPNQSLSRIGFDLASGRVHGDPITVNDSVWAPGDGSAQFAVSGTGTLIYLKSLGRRVPVVVDRTGAMTAVRGITPNVYQSPRYSPNGRMFALEVAQGGGADIWLYDVAAETFSKITDGGGFYAVWTPDNSRILYSRDEKAEVNVYSVPVNRSEPRRTVLAHHGPSRTQDLSHDGKHLLLRRTVGAGQYDLYVMAPDSGNVPTPWLATPFRERAPAFSPNDQWVAYSSNESGKEEVYVRPFTGPGGRIPVSSGGGTEPVWSHDGTELFYRAIDGSLQVVKVEAGAAFRVLSRPALLFQNHLAWYAWARQYDVAPDGKHFLFLRSEQDEIPLNVVVDWMNTEKKGSPK